MAFEEVDVIASAKNYILLDSLGSSHCVDIKILHI